MNQGYVQGLQPKWETHPVWQSDPAIAIYATNPRYGRTAGYAGPWNRQSGEAQEKYIIVDMFARARARRGSGGGGCLGAERARERLRRMTLR